MEYKTLKELGYPEGKFKIVEDSATIFFEKDYGYKRLNLGYEEVCAILEELKAQKKIELLEHVAVDESGVGRVSYPTKTIYYKTLKELGHTEDTIKVAPYGVNIMIDEGNTEGKVSLNYNEVYAIYKEMKRLQQASLDKYLHNRSN